MESKVSTFKIEERNTCVLCDSKDDVKWFCNDCQEALCDRCKEGHQRGKKTRNDDVVHIQQANKHSGAVLQEVCKIHPGKSSDLFCTECNVVMCSLCFTQKHKQHAFKHFEDEVASQQQLLCNQLQTLKQTLDQFKKHIANRQKARQQFEDSADIIQKDVKEHGSRLKAEIDSIVTTILEELSSIVDEEDNIFKQDGLPDENKVKEIEKLIIEVEQNSEPVSGKALFNLTGRLRAIIPRFVFVQRSVTPSPPFFVTGQPDSKRLKAMIGHFQHENENELELCYERKEIKSQCVQLLATFRVPEQNSILSICTSDDAHAWLSVNRSREVDQSR
ncbi:transcription intermediary factor 1-beta-like [Pecten maximus]|uniref:transcription intermediary factor 1-beta-like n=1 Tax=Pecten maximus TaxID=6579 RepID=UPI001458109E|nr:transcription intermediary factor 1-beta-like [Pecten maximus]